MTSWNRVWYRGVKKGICDLESKQMGSQIKVSDINC